MGLEEGNSNVEKLWKIQHSNTSHSRNKLSVPHEYTIHAKVHRKQCTAVVRAHVKRTPPRAATEQSIAQTT